MTQQQAQMLLTWLACKQAEKCLEELKAGSPMFIMWGAASLINISQLFGVQVFQESTT